jgi:hypothetical protein
VLQLCGIDVALRWPSLRLDGASIVPALRNQPGLLHDKLYSEVIGTSYGDGYYVQRGGYKLIRFTGDQHMPPHEELYRLLGDPLESNDLLARPMTATERTIHRLLGDDLWLMRRQGFALQYGTGCAGQAGEIAARTFVPPTIGVPYSIAVRRLAAGPPLPSWVLLGWSREISGAGVPLPVDLGSFGMPGCSLLVSPDRVAYAGPSEHSFFVNIPNAQMLVGSVFHAQCFAADPTANRLGMASSPGYRIVVGE